MLGRGIREAVILAAGNGSRMASTEGLPKPLTAVSGIPLLARVLDALPSSIQKVHVVIGYCADRIRSEFGNRYQERDLDWIDNPFYFLPNGVSLFCAQHHVTEPFLLLMSDHLFDSGVLESLCRQDCPPEGGLLAVDRKIDQVFDLPDAMKVELLGDLVGSIGKELRHYDAVDTGAFLLSAAVFEAFRESCVEQDLSLAGAVRMLARKRRMHAWGIGPAFWADVDTPESLREAERLLAAGHLRNGVVRCEQYFGATSRTA